MQKNWRIKDLLLWTTRYLDDRGMQEARLEAEILLAHALDKDRVYLYANYEKPINQDERDVYRSYLKRRIAGEPAAYIVGRQEFMSLVFMVSPDVLIPRPDTEVLVETILRLAAQDEIQRICDVGTGSGAIAISLAAYLQSAEVFAVDISAPALAIARQNADRHQVQVDFRLGDLLEPMRGEAPLDVIVANLPYVTSRQIQELDPGVKDYEPRLALLASGDGLDLYRRMIPQALQCLRPGGYLLIEIDPRQSRASQQMLNEFTNVRIFPDGAGRDRLVLGRRSHR
ncbi:MAG: peptide chain release factor N(5)-glutamine methyltransferase [Syntrophomonadaceae bacterium]|nr:peptide chain release factor N(5)-glutamine methyltransferase [Syntrophomonadaceae bacterium]